MYAEAVLVKCVYIILKVIVITDGEVCNTDQVIGLVGKEAQSSETR